MGHFGIPITTRRISILSHLGMLLLSFGFAAGTNYRVSQIFLVYFVIVLFSIIYSYFVYKVSYFNTNLRDYLSAFYFGISTMVILKNFKFRFAIEDLERSFNILVLLHLSYLTYLYIDYGSFGVYQLRIINDLSPWFSLNTYFNSVCVIGLINIMLIKYAANKVYYRFLWAAVFISILLSVSRQALLVFLMMSVLASLSNRRQVAYFVGILVVLYIAVITVNPDLLSGLQRWENISSDSYRLQVYVESFEIVRRNLLGIGLGNYIPLYHAALESSFLQFFVELGVFGLVGLVLFWSSAALYYANNKNGITLLSLLLLFMLSMFNEFLVSAPAALLVVFVSISNKYYAGF